jgi:hypothetical protein
MTSRNPLTTHHSQLALFFLFILLQGCKITFHKNREPAGLSISPSAKSFVVIDASTVYTPAIVLKKKRVGVVKEVKNQYLLLVTSALQKQLRLADITDSSLDESAKNKLARKDAAALESLQQKHSNSIIFILKDCAGGFLNKGSKRRNGGYKSPEYVPYFQSDWIILQSNTKNEKSLYTQGEHSPRDSYSLELRGPGFKANKNEIMETAEINAVQFAQLFKY